MGIRHPSFQFEGFAIERDLSRGSVVTEEERASTVVRLASVGFVAKKNKVKTRTLDSEGCGTHTRARARGVSIL
jgi:hypothetical protein